MKKNAKSKKSAATKKDDGTQLERVRFIYSSIPGTIEKLSHGEPTFFTPKRVFAIFANNHHGDARIAVWVPASPGVQTALIAEAPEIDLLVQVRSDLIRPKHVKDLSRAGILSRFDPLAL